MATPLILNAATPSITVSMNGWYNPSRKREKLP
jgi:hypothetical protein